MKSTSKTLFGVSVLIMIVIDPVKFVERFHCIMSEVCNASTQKEEPVMGNSESGARVLYASPESHRVDELTR
jgi:hypothetical protein